ncbi:MAG: acyl-CoA dehydrogenase family protein [Frankiaceae bacterium]|nr:acyl-CoA dehydrogenase family protein [Frankiaceae bacterium]MBV9869836.1 acyl-CoA dehydrogenase family protein [Frankiaceae bacterium]
MDVRLSAEQRALRDAVAQLVDRLGPSSVADLDDTERRAKLDAAVAAAGWRELRAPDDAGQPWSSAVEPALVAEELGRGLADTSYIGPVLAADLSRRSGASFQAATGTAGAVVDLTGSFAPVEGEAEALSALPPDDRARYLALGLALTSADLVGVMRGAIQLAVDYAGVRQQYGAYIGSFQAVQHLLADAQVAMEGSRSIALHAAWAVDELPADEALTAAAMSKAYCARAARPVCEASIQVHGGIGNTWECIAHVFLRRALVATEWFGGVGTNLDRVLVGCGIGAGA